MVLDAGFSGALRTCQTKIALADQAGSVWLDAVVSTQNNDAPWASTETHGVNAFARPLNKGFLVKALLDVFTPGAFDPGTIDGSVHRLENDLARSSSAAIRRRSRRSAMRPQKLGGNTRLWATNSAPSVPDIS